jgi:hypothetical protein
MRRMKRFSILKQVVYIVPHDLKWLNLVRMQNLEYSMIFYKYVHFLRSQLNNHCSHTYET